MTDPAVVDNRVPPAVTFLDDKMKVAITGGNGITHDFYLSLRRAENANRQVRLQEKLERLRGQEDQAAVLSANGQDIDNDWLRRLRSSIRHVRRHLVAISVGQKALKARNAKDIGAEERKPPKKPKKHPMGTVFERKVRFQQILIGILRNDYEEEEWKSVCDEAGVIFRKEKAAHEEAERAQGETAGEQDATRGDKS